MMSTIMVSTTMHGHMNLSPTSVDCEPYNHTGTMNNEIAEINTRTSAKHGRREVKKRRHSYLAQLRSSELFSTIVIHNSIAVYHDGMKEAIWSSKKQWELYFNLKKWNVQYTENDGNSLFRALSDEIHGDDTFYSDIRERIVEEIALEPSWQEAYFETEKHGLELVYDYCKRMECDGEYGGHLELYIASKLFEMNIIVYEGPNRSVLVSKDEFTNNQASRQTIHLLYFERNYYFIEQNQSIDTSTIKTSSINSSTPSDSKQLENSSKPLVYCIGQVVDGMECNKLNTSDKLHKIQDNYNQYNLDNMSGNQQNGERNSEVEEGSSDQDTESEGSDSGSKELIENFDPQFDSYGIESYQIWDMWEIYPIEEEDELDLLLARSTIGRLSLHGSRTASLSGSRSNRVFNSSSNKTQKKRFDDMAISQLFKRSSQGARGRPTTSPDNSDRHHKIQEFETAEELKISGEVPHVVLNVPSHYVFAHGKRVQTDYMVNPSIVYPKRKVFNPSS